MTPRIQELRNIIAKNDITIQSIKQAIDDINRKEAKLFRQMLDGTLDSNDPKAVKQKLEQFEVSREDKKSLIDKQLELTDEKNAAIEELMNLFRIQVELPEVKNMLNNEIPQTEEPAPVARPQTHPGTVSPAVRGGKR